MCVIENLLILFNLLLLQLIILKQKTNLPSQPQQPTQCSNSHVPCVSMSKQTESLLNPTENSVASKNQSVKIIDLSKNDNINPPKSAVSESEASNKSEPIIIPNQIISASLAQNLKKLTTLDLIDSNSNDLEEIDAIDTSETSVMNIKITNITSLPPEVFESAPDVCEDVTLHKNTIDNSLLASANKTEQLITHVPSVKRSVHEGNFRKTTGSLCVIIIP